MRTKQLFLILALLCAIAQGAWAQANWDEVYAMTGTTTADWTQLNAGSSTGRAIGTAGTTTYYYAGANLTFSNSTAGGSGLTILGTVYLYVPEGVTVTCTGANASGQTGAGAGIELTADNSLFLLGSGSVNATGGNAANGGSGTDGGDAYLDYDNDILKSGTGGNGGNGGGGAGAGIGTRGGDGGSGGTGGLGHERSGSGSWASANGNNGGAGNAGATAGAMGDLYMLQSSVHLTATGGAASLGGNCGVLSLSVLWDGAYNWSAPGGGGGAASNIGTGGPGGGGGGGGAGGCLEWAGSGYYYACSGGGKGGTNGDGTATPDGGNAEVSPSALNNGTCTSNSTGWTSDHCDYGAGHVTDGTGGSGGAAGSASTSEQAITMTVRLPSQNEWDMVCRQTKTSQSQWKVLLPGSRKGATIGTADATTYYFATGDRTFTNVNARGSGLTILGTVYLFIPSGNQITCKGTHASGTTGAGAGIELTAGNTLYLIGSGKLVATGGNAAGGSNGGKGGDASFDSSSSKELVRGGGGGRGGDGGGGAGAGIGTHGADGGIGGAGGAGTEQ